MCGLDEEKNRSGEQPVSIGGLMEQTLALLECAHQGDKKARDKLIEDNIGLVWSVARRFKNRGVELEDLFQIGSIGLIKAVDKFDCGYDVKFSTYAVPMIMGEIRRFLRDDGMIKVSRSLKELSAKMYMLKEQMEKDEGREPTLAELAERLLVSPEEAAEAMDAYQDVESLQKVIGGGEGHEMELMDRLENEADESEGVLNRLVVQKLLDTLEGTERQLVWMRYFQDMTQSSIAKEMGMTQVQVSRMEKKILSRLRQEI